MTTNPEQAAPAADGLVLLHASDMGDYSPALTLGRGWPTEIKLKVGDADKSVPVTYLDKDLIEEGQYVHPKTGRAVNASRAQLKDWVDKFHRMAGEGIEFGIPADHRMKAADNLGYVKDAKLVDVGGKTRLRLTHALIGEDAAMLAVKNRASLGIDPDYIDAKGRKWGSAIIHSSITPDPVIFGMGSFTPTFLSRGQEREAQMLFLSAQETPHSTVTIFNHSLPPGKIKPFPFTTPERSNAMTPELRKRLEVLAGVAEGTPDDVLLSRVADEAEKQQADMTEFASQITLSREAAATAERERDEAKGQLITLSREAPEPNTEVLYERSLRVSDRLDSLVGAGYTRPGVDKLKSILLGNADAPNVIALSRDAGTTTDCLAAQIADWATENRPAPKTGSQTGVQLLSREQDAESEKRTVKSAYTGKEVPIPA